MTIDFQFPSRSNIIDNSSPLTCIYSPNKLRQLRPPSSLPLSVDTSFIKPRKRGKKGGIKAKRDRRPNRPFLPSVLTGNVRSLNNKTDELYSLGKYNCDYRSASILALTETWLSQDTPSAGCELDGFTLHRGDRVRPDRQTGGGVCTYINNKWCHQNNSIVLSKHCDNNIELLTVSIRPFYLPREFTKVVIITTYIPPDANNIEANNVLYNEIEKAKRSSPDCVILLTGDFNQCKFKFPGFYQFVNCNTRGDTILDLFYCNIKLSYRCLSRAPLGSSDHNMLLLLPNYKPVYKRSKPIKKTVDVWNEKTYAELQGCFESTDWSVFVDTCCDVNELNECVTNYIQFCVENVCDKKEIVVYPNNKPWVTKTLKLLLDEKKILFLKGDKQGLKVKQREIKKEIVECKKNYKDKLERGFRSGDVRDTWRGLKTVVNYNKSKSTPSCDIDLNELNRFYARFDGGDSEDEINEIKADLLNGVTEEGEIVFTERQVRREFERVNERKACGPDGMKGKVLKVCAEQLCYIFTCIFNMSMQQSCIPAMWKTSKIVPIPKKDKVSCMNDLRPVALTSIVMKCFERLVLAKLNFKVAPQSDPLQFAYQPSRSVDDALNVFINNIYRHLDRPKSYCRILFVDFSSAFNTIRPILLVEKLKNMNINPHLISWILDFLLERTQFVEIHEKKSEVVVTNVGAPQGCVLSPRLFTVYTNDCTSKIVPLLKFADDTALQGLIINDDESAYRSEIDKFVTWCDDNFLNLNVGKTKEMIIDFRKNRNCLEPIIINDQIIEQVLAYKYLGIFIDNKLQWNLHTDSVVNKLNKRMYFIRKLNEFEIDKTLCTLFFRSVLETIIIFCITVWGGNANKCDVKRINKIINNASKYTNHVSNVEDLYKRFCLSKLNKIINDISHPLYCCLMFSQRSHRLLSIKTKTQRHLNSFLPSSVRMYNSLP